MKKKKAVFNWSGGKDSALALYNVINSDEYEIVSLLTTINTDTKRSSMHGIPEHLLYKQAESIGLPIYIVRLQEKCSMEDYSRAMQQAIEYFKQENVKYFIFGDIFLEDVIEYREKHLNENGITLVEPLLGKSTNEVIKEFFGAGLKTVIVTTNADLLGEEFVGKQLSYELIEKFPKDIDICGENGEYHTFCFAGGIFKQEINYKINNIFLKSYDIKDEKGQLQTYSYWHTDIT